MSLQTNLVAAFARLVLACNVLAGRVQPPGGSAGQVLTKTAAADYAAAWQTPATGDGVGNALTAVQLYVPFVAQDYAEVVVANAAVTPGSRVVAHLAGELDAENDLETLADIDLRVFAVAELGQIRFVLTACGFFTGPFKVNYEVFV